MTADRPAAPAELRRHGDTIAGAGQLDFAVNVVPGGPPDWLRRELHAALGRVAAYPDDRPAADALAARHGRPPGEVVCANGSAEALWLLATVVRPSLAVVVTPSFTEPEAALRAAGHPVQRAWRDRASFALDPDAVPRAADLVVVGNPDGPTVRAALAARGLAVRPCHTFPGLTPDHLRVAVRDPADNQRLVDALRQIV